MKMFKYCYLIGMMLLFTSCGEERAIFEKQSALLSRINEVDLYTEDLLRFGDLDFELGEATITEALEFIVSLKPESPDAEVAKKKLDLIKTDQIQREIASMIAERYGRKKKLTIYTSLLSAEAKMLFQSIEDDEVSILEAIKMIESISKETKFYSENVENLDFLKSSIPKFVAERELQQIASSAAHYFSQYDKKSVKVEDLLGDLKYIRSLDESNVYPDVVSHGDREIVAKLPNGEVVKLTLRGKYW